MKHVWVEVKVLGL